jgi:hypothetical protein
MTTDQRRRIEKLHHAVAECYASGGKELAFAIADFARRLYAEPPDEDAVAAAAERLQAALADAEHYAGDDADDIADVKRLMCELLGEAMPDHVRRENQP